MYNTGDSPKKRICGQLLWTS